jgi:hypothetical protein
VLVAGMLVPALAQGIPVIIMDFPPSDAASTFKDFTNYVWHGAKAFETTTTKLIRFLMPPSSCGFEASIATPRSNKFCTIKNEVASQTLVDRVK